MRKRILTGLVLVGLVAGLVGAPAATAATTGPGRQTYTGAINGAEYRVETPRRWNGTLILFSHGYIPEGMQFPPGIALTHRPETEQWLLDHGYALAASDYRGRTGLAIEEAPLDQIALLDWFDDEIGRPRRTIATGFSMGGGIATKIAERHPRRIAGVLSMGGLQDGPAELNRGLDVTFAVRTLLTDDPALELVKASDPAHSVAVLQRAVQQALTTPAGRAKLALIGAIGGLPAWATAHEPKPTELVTAIQQLTWWTEAAYIMSLGPTGRVDIERRAGGNPSANTGVDYTRQLAAAGADARALVARAYQAAGLDVQADLRALAAAPRIAADRTAAAWLYRYGVTDATTPTPVVTLHGLAEGLITSDARWYGEQVRRFGDPSRLRQLYVDRGNHGAFSAADELTALRVLLHRVETGRWADLRPATLNARVAAFPPAWQSVLDLYTFSEKVLPPAFTSEQPPRALRASR